MVNRIIFVLGGGYSPEREVSLGSASYVYGELKKVYGNTYFIDIAQDRWCAIIDNEKYFTINKANLSFVDDNGDLVAPDIVVNLIHGTPGENGILQGYFETLGIKHTSCSSGVSALTFDKIWTKRALANSGIAMANDIVVSDTRNVDYEAITSALGLPLFVKPSNSGSSFGVTKVKSIESLPAAINEAYTPDGEVIIEAAISGREVACGIYVTERGATLLPITEILSENEFFDYEAKYKGASQEITPADFSTEMVTKLNNLTLKIYKQLRCRGFVRIDYIIDGETPYFIEVNTIPGMSQQSIIPQQLAHSGITVCDMFNEIFNDL